MLNKQKTVCPWLMVVLLAGCGPCAGDDVKAARDTVLKYNQLLAEGYAKMDMTLLQKVATQEQAEKVYTHMAALGEAKIRMESQLVDIHFFDVRWPEENVAQVKTRETWNYTHVNIDAKMPRQTTVTGLVYTLSYVLLLQHGQWFVSSVTVLEKEESEEKHNDTRQFASVIPTSLEFCVIATGFLRKAYQRKEGHHST